MAVAGENPTQIISADFSAGQPMAQGQLFNAAFAYGNPMPAGAFYSGGAGLPGGFPSFENSSSAVAPSPVSPFFSSESSDNTNIAGPGAISPLAFRDDFSNIPVNLGNAVQVPDFSIGPTQHEGGVSGPPVDTLQTANGESRVHGPVVDSHQIAGNVSAKDGGTTNTATEPESLIPTNHEAPAAPNPEPQERPTSNLVETPGSTDAERQANANVRIAANGEVSVDTEKLQRDGYQAKVWIDPGYNGTTDEIKSKLIQALNEKGINLQIPSTLPSSITNRNVTPDTKPDGGTKPDEGTKPDGGTKPDEGTKPDGGTEPDDGSCPDGNCNPKPGPRPGPKPDGDTTPVTPPDSDENKPNVDGGDNKPNTDSNSKPNGPAMLNDLSDRLLGKKPFSNQSPDKGYINPKTMANLVRSMMSVRGISGEIYQSGIFQRMNFDADGDGIITEEERAAGMEKLEAYLASDAGKKEITQLEVNINDIGKTLEDPAINDQQSLTELKDLPNKFKNFADNKEFFGNLATAFAKNSHDTLSPTDLQGNNALIPEKLQTALTHLAVAKLSKDIGLDLKNPPNASDQAAVAAYSAKRRQLFEALGVVSFK